MQDHVNINFVIWIHEENRTQTMYHVMRKTGLIRWSPERWSAELIVAPTNFQIDTLKIMLGIKSLYVEYILPHTRIYKHYDDEYSLSDDIFMIWRT